MSKYDVTFTETVVYTIRVDANDEDEAYEKADEIATDLFSKMNSICTYVSWENCPNDERIEKVIDND